MAKELFHKATWAEVRAGDVVLMPWSSIDQVFEAEVVEAEAGRTEKDGRPAVFASLSIDEDRCVRWTFDPEAVAYVRSRL
ncbi:MAG TPA: hypothetical protein VJZ77_09325 [Blastocatellia bacterium]|nr:hypothetical protein [Blastocatellia bacterium]